MWYNHTVLIGGVLWRVSRHHIPTNDEPRPNIGDEGCTRGHAIQLQPLDPASRVLIMFPSSRYCTVPHTVSQHLARLTTPQPAIRAFPSPSHSLAFALIPYLGSLSSPSSNVLVADVLRKKNPSTWSPHHKGFQSNGACVSRETKRRFPFRYSVRGYIVALMRVRGISGVRGPCRYLGMRTRDPDGVSHCRFLRGRTFPPQIL
jgi:hypothetical protein